MSSRPSTGWGRALSVWAVAAVVLVAGAVARTDEEVRSETRDLLQRIAERDEAALRTLAEALESELTLVRMGTVQALAGIGAEAAAAVPALAAAVREADEPLLRAGAASALAEIGPVAAPAVPALIEALADPDAQVRYRAADALGNLGRESPPDVPAIVAALATTLRKDAETGVRERAAWGLGEIGPAAAAAVPALIEALRDPRHEVVLQAAASLGFLGAAAQPAVPALRAAMDHPIERVGSVVQVALQRIEAAAPTPVAAPHPGGPADGVRPGAGIAKIALGQPRVGVHKLLGEPGASFEIGDGRVCDSWKSAKSGHDLRVAFEAGAAAQVLVTSPSFRTASGLSTRSRLAEIRQSFPGLAAASSDGAPDGYEFHDELTAGVAFQLAAGAGPDASPVAIAVHRPGQPVLAACAALPAQAP